MTKPYHEMTPAERLAARIAKNREIEQRVSERKSEPAPAARRRSASSAGQAKPGANAFDKFQEIKRTQGIDAASEYVHTRMKAASE
jgi:hypothetical protein